MSAESEQGMPRPGTMLDGKYRLVRQLGSGGMGIVYEADHIRLRQPFAIKILQPEFAQDSEFLTRFEREARAAAVLRSPHIVRVFDVDVSSEGLTYMVMELLEGRDLAEEALNAPLAVPQVIDWLVQICSGLQEAHDNGIVHRDLKPANIFITKIESGERIAKVLDFGISKFEVASTAHTDRTAGALGTPTYMAPEQIRGRSVDARTDLWSLGVMLYRLLSGAWPFACGQGDAAYMAAVLTDTPVPFETVRPDLPNELARAIMRALEKDPASRHQSSTEMATALAPFGSGRGPLAGRASLPVSAMTPSTGSYAMLTPSYAGGPQAIVVPAALAARSDRAGSMDTIVDAAGHSIVSAPATVFAPPSQEESIGARRGSGLAMIIAAACIAGSLGIGSYLFLTSRKVVPSAAAAAAAAQTAPAETTGAAPPPGFAAEGRPATTGVPESAVAAPSASASVPRKRPTRPATPASSPSHGAAPAAGPDMIPDHL